ncbi:hypothetical protein BSK59_05505 [Paenibacillus odorifer]|uniref:hypothetical protein n=1 Tax=Paenibacillus odorifer TaxID=189426 RepID=UPI00096FB381|nr:hypothetical protein [Paenibacillus odorifer]OME60874.1 hypothetical protein BSK59_05505 [Paenibacillus odorifer]
MEHFLDALDKAIKSWSILGNEWEKIEPTHSDKLADKYPLDKDFREVVRELMEWKDQLQNEE